MDVGNLQVQIDKTKIRTKLTQRHRANFETLKLLPRYSSFSFSDEQSELKPRMRDPMKQVSCAQRDGFTISLKVKENDLSLLSYSDNFMPFQYLRE